MIRAVIYKSATGSCERYARVMSRMLAIPAYPADRCPLPKGIEVVYVGWIMGGRVSGLDKALKNYKVCGVVQVGMSPPGAALGETCWKNHSLASDIPVFTLQGGFDMSKLSAPLRLIMKKINRGIVARLEAKDALSDAEKATLEMARNGKGEPATWDGILEVVDWAVALTEPPEVIKWREP